MANRYRAVIFDDDTDRAKGWCKWINALSIPGLEISALEKEEINKQLTALYERRDRDKNIKVFGGDSIELDKIDILIVDYDLRLLKEHMGFATGEEIAYTARLFSMVKVVIVVNHPEIGLNDFDLTLQTDKKLKGDIYIGHKQIANPCLWFSPPRHDGFAPWNWPIILDDVDQYERCLQDVLENLDTKLSDFFGFSSDGKTPSPEMSAYLEQKDCEVTLRGILDPTEDAERTVPFVKNKDLKPLFEDEKRLARVLVSILKKWLRKWVLPPQTLIADAPHFGVAVPWSLIAYQDSLTWQRLCNKAYSEIQNVVNVFRDEAKENVFERSHWLGRATFFVSPVQEKLESKGLPLKDFDFSKIPDRVFAENLSRFVNLEDATEYRHVFDGGAQTRAIAEVAREPFNPKSVVYVPQSLML